MRRFKKIALFHIRMRSIAAALLPFLAAGCAVLPEYVGPAPPSGLTREQAVYAMGVLGAKRIQELDFLPCGYITAHETGKKLWAQGSARIVELCQEIDDGDRVITEREWRNYETAR